MAKHIRTGIIGEQLAYSFLESKGFNIIQTNWRHKHWEIDIIASFENKLHFIEVKTRRSTTYGTPEESVSRKKIKNLIDAAEEYILLAPEWKWICFDILSINLFKDEPPKFFFLEDVYL